MKTEKSWVLNNFIWVSSFYCLHKRNPCTLLESALQLPLWWNRNHLLFFSFSNITRKPLWNINISILLNLCTCPDIIYRYSDLFTPNCCCLFAQTCQPICSITSTNKCNVHGQATEHIRFYDSDLLGFHIHKMHCILWWCFCNSLVEPLWKWSINVPQ